MSITKRVSGYVLLESSNIFDTICLFTSQFSLFKKAYFYYFQQVNPNLGVNKFAFNGCFQYDFPIFLLTHEGDPIFYEDHKNQVLFVSTIQKPEIIVKMLRFFTDVRCHSLFLSVSSENGCSSQRDLFLSSCQYFTIPPPPY